MEIETKDQLKKQYPELTAEIAKEAAKAAEEKERKRIAGIDALAMPGFEEIIASAKADPEQDAGSVAQAMILAQKKSGGDHLRQVQADVTDSKANEVPAAGEPEGSAEENVEAAAKAAVAAWKQEGARS